MVPAFERAVFQRLNDLPSALHPPLYVVMQAGSLAAVPAAAVVARLRGSRQRARTIAVTGTAVWIGAKAAKRWVRRGRPSAELDGVVAVQVRGSAGRDEMGFPSGHAAVAFCLARLLAPTLPARWRWIPWTVATTVAGARIYVGAHLPLDAVGGAALGIAAGQAAHTVTRSG